MLIDYVVYFYFLFWFLINFVDHVTKKSNKIDINGNICEASMPKELHQILNDHSKS